MFFKKKQELSRELVAQALSKVIPPGTGKDVISLGFVKNVEVSGSKVKIDLQVDPGYPAKEQVEALCRQAASQLKGVEFVHISTPPARPGNGAGKKEPPAPARISLPNINRVIAVASGKGGVGKSTVSINLAVSLSKMGKSVGLLDADIYGPSLPMMMGINERPSNTGGKIAPLQKFDVRLMSMGFVVPEDQPVVWRGPMVHGALTQFMTQVDWGNLDYLIIDMPPGTGDAQLTMSQTAPLSGAIIVTTPQDLSLIDARKGLKMFESVQIPILGIVENMAGFVTPDGKTYNIFSGGGGKKLSEESNVPLLGSVPLDPRIAEGGDQGKPISLGDNEVAKIYQEIAGKIETPSGKDSDFKPLNLDW